MKKDNLCKNSVSDLLVNYLKGITMKMFQQSKYSVWTQRWQSFLFFLFGKSEVAQANWNAEPASMHHHNHIELEMFIKQTNVKNQREIYDTKRGNQI